MMQEIMTSSIEGHIKKMEKTSEVPQSFQPQPGLFVHYQVSGLDWNHERVILSAKTTITALLDDGSNVTFVPTNTSPDGIPLDNWNMAFKTAHGGTAHLLQVRSSQLSRA
jgi:hypothetical protein